MHQQIKIEIKVLELYQEMNYAKKFKNVEFL